MKQIGLQIILNWPKDLNMWHIQDPGALADDWFKALQPGYVDLFNGPSFKSLSDRVLATDRLLADYERLNKLGGAVVRMVENRLLEFDQATIDNLSRIHDTDRRIGYPEIITNGRVFGFMLRGWWRTEFDPTWTSQSSKRSSWRSREN